MRYVFSTIGALFLLFSISLSAAELTVHITGVDEAKAGNIMVGVYDSEATFLKDDARIAEASVPITDAKEGLIKVPFNLQVSKTYAVAAYHDTNGNEELDKNFFGIPKEGYGFSNNARSTFGPPSFEKAAFQLILEKNQMVSFYLSY
ncbi:conserved hypothetical protein, secreted [Beggiatoa sp. PS]|nr:conserved hypothetical protein, secreted [Beggiatoa sp. PS]